MKKFPQNIPTLDLHGYLTADVFDAIDGFILKAQSKGASAVRIITGKGGGKVKAKTLEYLKMAHYKAQMENEGSFYINLA